ncbi:MAG: pirin family protein [Neisseria sp.]|nr:pirin family protein [Neisseria sp.]
MTNWVQKLQAKTKDVGGIPVARLLPQATRRTIGAWCFLDHAGPARFAADEAGMQVGSHPHCNLQTFTWMLAGEVWHQDSLGNRQMIRPEQVNLMTAGTGREQGICHTEQTPEHVDTLHAVQLWIALPMNQRIAASFHHYPELPKWTEQGVDYILTTGKFGERQAPTVQYSPLVGVDIKTQTASRIALPQEANFEYGVLVLSGSASINGEEARADELLFWQAREQVELELATNSHVFFLGGEPLPHPTVMWWNFVADSKTALREAVSDWNTGSARFGEIDLNGTTLSRLPAPPMP